MDDDGRPQRADCLDLLLRRARTEPAALVGPLVLDVDRPDWLAFPIRISGHTRFLTEQLRAHGPVRGFVHLFNGALISRELLEQIGLPDRRLFIRGDEVEFLFRALRAGASVLLETDALFLHPGSAPEIHPILGGLYHAVVPACRTKQYYLFRNPGLHLPEIWDVGLARRRLGPLRLLLPHLQEVRSERATRLVGGDLGGHLRQLGCVKLV